MKYNKIFVIGFNKTGTCSIAKLGMANNLRVQHNPKKFNNIENFDLFADNGNFEDFKELDINYPNSIFILNVRPLDKWIISRFKDGLKFKNDWSYPATEDKIYLWINQRFIHYINILEYFKYNTGKLVIINIEEKGWEKYLADKLGFENFKIEPQNIHKNKDTDEYNKIIKLTYDTLKKINITGEETKNLLFNNLNLNNYYLKFYKNNIKI